MSNIHIFSHLNPDCLRIYKESGVLPGIGQHYMEKNMNRRDFLHLCTVAGVAAIALPRFALAGASSAAPPAQAGEMFYTAASPGRWAKKVKPHMPVIELENNRVQVITNHPMKAHGHYITKHVLLDSNFKFLAEKVFDPTKDAKAISAFTLNNYNGKLYVVSHCNLHDSWLGSVVV